MIQEIDINSVVINDELWSNKIKVIEEVTIYDNLNKCETTGRINNFKVAGNKNGAHQGQFYNDSDVYKVLEGISYILSNKKDEVLEARADEIISYIKSAQQENGYINTYFTLVKPNDIWTDMNLHEMYCGGHLIEAGIAYIHATGKRELLDVAIKFADHLVDKFGDGKKKWVPGHQEIELALIRLYKETNNDSYLNLSHWLIEQRGKGLFKSKSKGFDLLGLNRFYYQDYTNVSKMKTGKGHAVRAMYMYSAMSDLVNYFDKEYMTALDKIWDNITAKKMYITGGIGVAKHGEGFAKDYYLPNKDAYCETCASIGMVFWNYRMFLNTGNSKYIDVLERSMYNTALAGLSEDGRLYFYENRLETDGSHNRKEWYDTSCCPTQLSRFIPSIGKYIYAYKEDEIYVNLFIDSIITINDINIEMITIDSNIKIKVNGNQSLTLNIRYPEWADSYKIRLNNETIESYVEDGYIKILNNWNDDEIDITFDYSVKRNYSNHKVNANRGKVSISYGPFVYCVESIDCIDYDNLTINKNDRIELNNNSLYTDILVYSQEKFKMIPYYKWNNRGNTKMKVWIDENK